jgi:hypothetical protein
MRSGLKAADRYQVGHDPQLLVMDISYSGGHDK